jgi:hypothetical protein
VDPSWTGTARSPTVVLLFVSAEETHDDRHSVCSSIDEALKDRVLREGFNPVDDRGQDQTRLSHGIVHHIIISHRWDAQLFFSNTEGLIVWSFTSFLGGSGVVEPPSQY